MKLADKIRYLREVEGNLRGLGRGMTQQELVRAIQAEAGAKPGTKMSGVGISQSYLSQIESGARPHLTNTTRLKLAKFFKVHPGYLVDDPEGFQASLITSAREGGDAVGRNGGGSDSNDLSSTLEEKLDLWLVSGAERFRRDPALCRALLSLANHDDTRRCLLLMEAILRTPRLVDRLSDALGPGRGGDGAVVEKQIPPLRSAPVGMTTERVRSDAPLGMTKKDSRVRSRKGAARRSR